MSVIHKDWCAYHETNEPHIDDAPWCFECWHQFQSDEDLVEQDNRVRRELGMRADTTSADDVFCCPFCSHDF